METPFSCTLSIAEALLGIASIIGSGINGNHGNRQKQESLSQIASIIGSGINGNHQRCSIKHLTDENRFYYWKWN